MAAVCSVQGDKLKSTTAQKSVSSDEYNVGALPMTTVKNNSYYEYEMDISLPKGNLETFANADWTQYGRQQRGAHETRQTGEMWCSDVGDVI